MKKCFYCNNDIAVNEGRMIALEKPYANLWAHKGCARFITLEYLKENIQRVVEHINTSKGKG